MRIRSLSVAALFAALSTLSTRPAERRFDFGEFPTGQTPPGFRSIVVGQGKPAEWKIILEEVPPLLAPLSDKAPANTKRPVLAQLSQDPTDERFPLLVFDEEVFGDFTLTTRFKIVSGAAAQMAGIAFRIKDENNFYVARASALDGTFRFYRVVDGLRDRLIGPEVPIPKDTWHELTIECNGNHIHCLLNGKEAVPMLTDSTFVRGKVGFWTKSDSITYFTDAKMTYTPVEILAQTLVREAVREYPRIVGLKIYAVKSAAKGPQVVASKDDQDLGQPGGENERNVINEHKSYYSKDRSKGTVSITSPLRDRNGETIAAVRVTMKSFPGQTEDNAVGRAAPIVKVMQARAPSLEDLLQ